MGGDVLEYCVSEFAACRGRIERAQKDMFLKFIR